MKKLNIFVDETGDFGFSKNSSDLYGLSFVFHDSSDNITDKINGLNEKLKYLGYTGMIHTSDLVSKRGDYEAFDIIIRKRIFNVLFQFARKIPVKYYSIIVNKKYCNNKLKLRKELINGLNNLLNINYKYFSKFDMIVLYYDNGQKTIGRMLNESFIKFDGYLHNENFNKKEKRLFQVADMLAFIDKYNYKFKKGLVVGKNEKFFFEIFDIKNILNKLENKRLK